MKKTNILIAALLMVFATASLSAQKKCSMSIEECAAKMGMTVEECKKMCGDEASLTRVASANVERVVDLPACCYGSLTENGKACCAKYQTELAEASKLVDTQGNEVKMKQCASSWTGTKKCTKSDQTQVASVVMVREVEDAEPVTAVSKKSCKKSCSKTCASKKTKA